MKLRAIRTAFSKVIYLSKEARLQALLPAYLNESLPESRRRQVEAWLCRSPEARRELEAWRKVQETVLAQSERRPSPAARAALLKRVGQPARRQPLGRRPAPAVWSGLAGALFTLVALALLWLAVQPGVSLEWTVSGGELAAYRIYRAAGDSGDFRLLAEIRSRPGVDRYQYLDAYLIPGQAYVYRVEAVGQAGLPALSRSTVSSPLVALPGQLAVLCASLVIGYGLAGRTQAFLETISRERRAAV